MGENIQDKLDKLDSTLEEVKDVQRAIMNELESLSDNLVSLEKQVDEAVTKVVLEKIKDDVSIKNLLVRIAKVLGT